MAAASNKEPLSRADVVNNVAAETQMPQSEVDKVIRSFEATLKRQLQSGGEVRMVGLGTFRISERAARMGRNPKTGEAIKIGASKNVRFSAGKAFKDAISGASGGGKSGGKASAGASAGGKGGATAKAAASGGAKGGATTKAAPAKAAPAKAASASKSPAAKSGGAASGGAKSGASGASKSGGAKSSSKPTLHQAAVTLGEAGGKSSSKGGKKK